MNNLLYPVPDEGEAPLMNSRTPRLLPEIISPFTRTSFYQRDYSVQDTDRNQYIKARSALNSSTAALRIHSIRIVPFASSPGRKLLDRTAYTDLLKNLPNTKSLVAIE